MTGTLLDVTQFPQNTTFRSTDGTIVGMPELFAELQADLPSFGDLGFVMAKPVFWNNVQHMRAWDDPYRLVWFAGGWGGDAERHIANAVRVMRPMLRPVRVGRGFGSSLEIVRYSPSHFDKVVVSVNDQGNYPWGDYPVGGGVILTRGYLHLAGAVSTEATQYDDHAAARTILEGIANKIAAHNDLVPDD